MVLGHSHVMNKNNYTIRQATADDAQIVGSMVNALLCELFTDHFSKDELPEHVEAARSLMSTDHIYAFLAYDGINPVGLCTLHQCAAVYAKGLFGEISELYINPDCRSGGLGAMLIDAAKTFGRQQGWSIIEVGAPDVPRCQRTVDFYLDYGFSEVGPRLEIGL